MTAGGQVTFRWDVAGRAAYTVGNEMIVTCWDGTDWIPAWVASAVFSEPVSVLINPAGDDYGITDDGFEEAVGTIVVPLEAPPGVYRVAERIAFDTADGQSERASGEAFFTVVGS